MYFALYAKVILYVKSSFHGMANSISLRFSLHEQYLHMGSGVYLALKFYVQKIRL